MFTSQSWSIVHRIIPSEFIIICLVIFSNHIHQLSAQKARDQSSGYCDEIGQLDLHLLIPTSAHSNRTRLGEVKNLITLLFNEADINGDQNVQITTHLYKKQPRVKFEPEKAETMKAFHDEIRDINIRARAISARNPPTYATRGLQFFQRYYSSKANNRRDNVPAMMIFFITETLNRMDLTTMANVLVDISANTDVFTFLFIANPNGNSHFEKPTISLPHKSWNALAVDENSALVPYRDVLRRTMCRLARGNLCLMFKEAEKTDDKDIIQRSALGRTSTSVRKSGATHVQTNPDRCCGDLVYSKAYDSRAQKCCSRGTKTTNANVALIEDKCFD